MILRAIQDIVERNANDGNWRGGVVPPAILWIQGLLPQKLPIWQVCKIIESRCPEIVVILMQELAKNGIKIPQERINETDNFSRIR